VLGTVTEAMEATGADVSVVFVPEAGTKAAVIEAIDAAIPLVIVITEGIPVHDTAEFWAYATAAGNRTRIVGPNCPGVASPGKSNAGIIPADITTEGRIGLVSKSGTLTYQMMYELRDIGFSTAVGIGGDPIIGTTHIDCLRAFQGDPETDAIVMIGEIGGDAEERAAAFIEKNVSKPVVAYVAGFTAPEGKTMGHAGRDHLGLGRHGAGQEGGPGEGRRPRRPDPERHGPAGPRGHAGRLTAAHGSGSSAECAARLRAWGAGCCEAGAVTTSATRAGNAGSADGSGPGPASPGARPLVATGAIAAALAAGGGLALLTLLVLAGWIAAPHDGVGLTGVLRTASVLWLIGNHVGFALHGTGRIGMLPLGLVLLPGALLWRAGRWVVRAGGVSRLRHVGYAAVALATPYALIAGALAIASRSAQVAPSVPQAVSCGFLLALVAGGLGGARGLAPWGQLTRLLPDRPRSVIIGVVGALAVLTVSGALLAGLSLACTCASTPR